MRFSVLPSSRLVLQPFPQLGYLFVGRTAPLPVTPSSWRCVAFHQHAPLLGHFEIARSGLCVPCPGHSSWRVRSFPAVLMFTCASARLRAQFRFCSDWPCSLLHSLATRAVRVPLIANLCYRNLTQLNVSRFVLVHCACAYA